jgi:4,5-DOPA dioxygenase extradiol
MARPPVLFIGHGSPMNAIQNNQYTQMLKATGESIPQPKAVLVISAHWETQNTLVHLSKKPRTIYDFGGFPSALYQIQYPCAGAVDIAELLIQKGIAKGDHEWGLDHGAWTVLKYLAPKADVPCVQLSLNRQLDLKGHFQLAQSLRFLREMGVLILGSGNLIHNLRQISWQESAQAFDWAKQIDQCVKTAIQDRDDAFFLETWPKDPQFKLAHPSIEHYLPMIYTLGVRDEQDQCKVLFDEIHHGSIAMRCLRWG